MKKRAHLAVEQDINKINCGESMRSIGFSVLLTLAMLVAADCPASLFSNNIFERKNTAAKARTQLVGMSTADVLACMGVPEGKDSEGTVEVWAYGSGNGRTDTYGSISATGTATAVSSNQANVNMTGDYTAISHKRFCTVNVVFVDGKVARLNYIGPTGGFLSKDEQCAFAVQGCVK